MRRIVLSEEAAREMMTSGGVPSSVSGSADRVAVILTQSWCPQWHAMKNYLDQDASRESAEPGKIEGLDVYELIYDRLPFFPEFLAFKEDTFNNLHIPYVRYYRGGEFQAASNYIDRTGFYSLFQG